MERKTEVAEFLSTYFDEEAIGLLDGVEVLIDLDLPPHFGAAFTTINDLGKFDPLGRPVIAINAKNEMFGVLCKALIPKVVFDSLIEHEMTHLKQYSEGRLRFREDSTTESQVIIWKGVEYSYDSNNISVDEYFSLPWEEEAFEKQCAFLEERTNRPAGEWLDQFIIGTRLAMS